MKTYIILRSRKNESALYKLLVAIVKNDPNITVTEAGRIIKSMK